MSATLPPISNRVASVGLVVLLAYFAAASLVRPLRNPSPWSDFVTFYSAAQAFRDDRFPYGLLELRDEAQSEYAGWVGRYFYPPPFAAVTVQPLLLLPFDTARRVWMLIEATAYLLAAVLLAHVVFATLQPRALFCIGVLALPFAPMALNLRLGSVSALLLLLLSVFLWQRQAGHTVRAALALAASVVLKLSPALVVLYLLWRGERRLVAWTIGWAFLLVLVALPASGIDVYRSYMSETLPFLATANFSWFTNQSIDAFFWRLFVPNPDTTPWQDSMTLYRLGTFAASASVLVALLRGAARERQITGTPPPEWGVTLALCASVLVARVSWEYMFVLTLPAFALALRDVLGGRFTRRVGLLLVVAYALCAFPLPYTQSPWRAGLGLLLEAPRLYGVVLLFAIAALQRQGRANGAERVDV